MHLDAEDLMQAWADFKARPLVTDGAYIGPLRWAEVMQNDEHLSLRNQLILHYTSLVRYVALKVGARLPSSVDRDDLISYGMFGLIDAIERFQPELGNKFETYGIPRIHGQIFDEIRKLDWVPRNVRSRARDLESARAEVEAIHGRVTETLLARHLGLNSKDLGLIVNQANVSHVDSLSGFHEVVEMPDLSMNPADIVQTGEVAELLGMAIGDMDDRSKVILTLYYVHEMTLAEIGKILGVTESRVCQLQSKVLVALGESLNQGLAVA